MPGWFTASSIRRRNAWPELDPARSKRARAAVQGVAEMQTLELAWLLIVVPVRVKSAPPIREPLPLPGIPSTVQRITEVLSMRTNRYTIAGSIQMPPEVG